MADAVTDEVDEEKSSATFELDTDGGVVDPEEGDVEVGEQEADPEPKSEEEEYSEKVQARINRLVYDREEAKRNEATAIDMGRAAIQESEQLKQRISGMDSGFISEAEERVKSQKAQAATALKSAIEDDDVDGQVAAQEMISRLTFDEERVKVAKRQVESRPVQQQQQQQQHQQQQQQQQPQAPPPSERAISWAAQNPWFGNDGPMTQYAMAQDRRLVDTEGVAPDSDEYYNKLESSLRGAFPSAFDASAGNGAATSPRRPSRAVAPVGESRRPAGSTPKVVRLNEREMVIAKKFCPSTDPKVLEKFIKSYAQHKADIAARGEDA